MSVTPFEPQSNIPRPPRRRGFGAALALIGILDVLVMLLLLVFVAGYATHAPPEPTITPHPTRTAAPLPSSGPSTAIVVIAPALATPVCTVPLVATPLPEGGK